MSELVLNTDINQDEMGGAVAIAGEIDRTNQRIAPRPSVLRALTRLQEFEDKDGTWDQRHGLLRRNPSLDIGY